MERIKEMLIKDKFTNPEVVAEILKSEILPLAKNFLLLKDEPIVRYKIDKDNIVFDIELRATRIKPYGNRLM